MREKKVLLLLRCCHDGHGSLRLKIRLKGGYSRDHLRKAAVQVQCYFTPTETIRTIRDGEPRTATSTFSQRLSSYTKVVNVFDVGNCLYSAESLFRVRQ